MKRILRSPITNTVGISVFSVFYALVFWSHCGSADFEWLKYYDGGSPFWRGWSELLTADIHGSIATFLLIVTVLIVILLISHRQYDEYHASILASCLITALILTMIAIAVFFLLVLHEPVWIAGKFMLFITVHWTTVVFANLVFILICRRR